MVPVIAEFEAVDFTVPIVVVTAVAAALLAASGRGLWNAGRPSGPPGATPRWRRLVDAVLRQAGYVAMVGAVVVLVGGTTIGIRTKSIEQVERDDAAAVCAEEYPRFVAWQNAGNALDNWWTGDPLPEGTAPKRATRREFIDRCVAMTVD